ncbi:MAG: cysteine hydrolase [Alphaproteobacteria bacterium]|jgi:nicotinamidase-related amidase|nr:cysteine hydrolase [Rhodospirillaceae bacterium]MDP6407306.1 cysteine hydrolase [Alphaproteobacteria bacterium]MDP6621024.1 cysteine hydrolase [Alphaproteobacteria bacterium]|tara:strand:+ start:54 stop:665 length:612 start_codon:yes stop_codon:yes gene_type:complete
MAELKFDAGRTGLMLVDLQNDFLHPDGAYGRAGVGDPAIAALPRRLAPLVETMRAAGGWIVSTHFTLVPGRDGEPFISAHLRQLRPFLGRGDFLPGSFGQALIEELAPADLAVEKVAFSAFYQSRLEFVLGRAGIDSLIFAGIVSNGGVASTVRDAHVRDFSLVVLEDGCAAFGEEAHRHSMGSLSTIATISNCAEVQAALQR